MADEMEKNILILTDEDGQDFEVEHLDTVEYNNQVYAAFIPATMSLDDSYELIIMKIVLEENGDEALVTLEDEEEEAELFQIFCERLEESFDEEGEEDAE